MYGDFLKYAGLARYEPHAVQPRNSVLVGISYSRLQSLGSRGDCLSMFKCCVIISGFMIALLPQLASADTPEQVFSKSSPSIVVVVASAKGKFVGLGSGVVTEVGKVITNCHVAQRGENLQVRHLGKIVRASLQFVDNARDLCQLSVPNLDVSPVTLSTTKNLRVGQRVYAIGAPQGLELTLSEGLISSLRQYEGAQYIQTSAAISPGSSGGGLFDDQGRLIGITSYYFSEGQNLNFALPVDWIVELPHRARQAAKLTDESRIEWVNRSFALTEKEDWAGLLAHSKQWVKRMPGDPVALFSLSIAYNHLGQYDQAINTLQEVVRIMPEGEWVWDALGIAYSGAKQYEQAVKAFQESLRIQPEHSKTWYNLGITYGELTKFHDAIQAYRESLRVDPEYADAWYNLGNIYFGQKKYDAAVNAYREVLRIEPRYAKAWYSLGNIYTTLGQNDQAIQAYQGTLNILPDDAKTWRNLGLVYSRQGQRDRVLEIYKTLRKLDPAMADDYFNALILR